LTRTKGIEKYEKEKQELDESSDDEGADWNY